MNSNTICIATHFCKCCGKFGIDVVKGKASWVLWFVGTTKSNKLYLKLMLLY